MPEVFPLANYGLPALNSWQVAEITNDLEPKDVIRTQRDVSSLILAAIQEEPEGKAAGTNPLANLRHYDGLRSKYNLWDKAVQRNLATVGLLKLDKLYKHNNLDELQTKHWNRYCSKADRTLIYNVVMSTLTPEARDTAEREDCNGLMVLNQLWRQWGAPNLNNTIHALRELLSVKVEMHENPAPAFSAVERILRDYFPDSGTNMKIALVFMTLSETKYKSILDTLNDQTDMPSYANLKDQILTFFRRKQDAYEQSKQAAAETKKRNAGGEKTTGKRKRNENDAKAFATGGQQDEQGHSNRKRLSFCKNCHSWNCPYGTANCPVGKNGGGGGGGDKNGGGGGGGDKNGAGGGGDSYCPKCGVKAPNHRGWCVNNKKNKEEKQRAWVRSAPATLPRRRKVKQTLATTSETFLLRSPLNLPSSAPSLRQASQRRGRWPSKRSPVLRGKTRARTECDQRQRR